MNSLAKLQKKGFWRESWGRLAIVYLMFLVICPQIFAAEVVAVPSQENWQPNKYKLVCDPPENCLYSDEVHQKTEELMPEVVNTIRRMNFPAPTLWGKRAGQVTTGEYIELQESDREAIAFAVGECDEKVHKKTFVGIGSEFTLFDSRDYLLFYFMAHEIFHVVQYEYDFYRLSCPYIPGWIREGSATAVGQAATRKQYPGVFPEKRDDRVADNFSGLRRYDIPLPVQKSPGEKKEPAITYRTSSFWRHLADTYYRGRYDFFNDYMNVEDYNGLWFSWLRSNVELGTGVDFGMLFGGFLADYAGWGDRGYPGGYFGRKKWLETSFSGCEEVYLNRSEAADYVEFDLLPLSGKCIEVNVSALGPNGIQEGESAAIQIAATVMSGSPSNREGLHMALAASNDKDNFHCAREVKKHRKKGVGKCLFIPDDGKIRLNGGTVDARVWNVIAQEKGDPKEETHEVGERRGELSNLYTIGYTPLIDSPNDMKNGGKNPITVRLYFVLDVAKLDIQGNKKGAVGHFADGDDPQTTLPKQDASGKRVNSFSKPDQLQPPVSLPATAPPQVEGKLSYFMVGQSGTDGDSAPSSVLLAPLKPSGSQGELEPYPLSVGETGEYPILVIGSLNGEPLFGTGPGSLDIQEFSDLVFRARFNAVVCRQNDLLFEQDSRGEELCRNPVPLSGDIVKAFAGSRLPGYLMLVERTEGTEIYRKANEQGMAEWFSPPPGPDGTDQPGSSPDNGDGNSGGGNLPACACTCDERMGVQNQADELKARKAAGEEVSVGDFMGLMRCSEQCQSEYLVCAMVEGKENRARKKAEKAAREEKLAGECDCSCAVVNTLQSRTEDIIKGMQAGKSVDLGEMQRIGICASTCQKEIISCAQQK